MRYSVLLLIITITLAAGTMSSALVGKPIKRVVVAIAMEAEAAPFVDYLKLKKDESFFPSNVSFEAFVGNHNSCDVTVVTNGKDSVYGTNVDNVGTVPAALITYLTLQKYDGKVDLLINAGTCGGFRSKGAEIGDVFLTTAVANHDRRIPIPGFDTYGIGKVKTVVAETLAKEMDAKLGVCSTGNSLDMSDVDKSFISSNDASIKDMEAAAISWSCEMFETPHFGVKVVTDIVDGEKPTQEEFFENLSSAANKLQQSLPIIIDHVCGKQHDEL